MIQYLHLLTYLCSRRVLKSLQGFSRARAVSAATVFGPSRRSDNIIANPRIHSVTFCCIRQTSFATIATLMAICYAVWVRVSFT